MKSIPAALVTELEQPTTSVCFLLRVYTKSGVLYGFTSLDADVTYNPATVDPHNTGDAWGSAIHKADNGFTPERMQATADLAVDNTELRGWVSDTGITEAQIRSGLLDFAKVRLYRVNYLDLTQGHELVGTGTLGETEFTANGWKVEFRSLVQQLMQPDAVLYSLTCRAIFGSKPIGTGGDQPEEKYPCGVDWVWVSGEVTAVDTDEPDRIFTDSAITEADGHFSPGVVEWLTGNNAGEQMEVDSQASDVFTLALNLSYPIEVGDTFRVRQDCDKTKAMCKDVHANLVNMRAEIFIPVADGGASMIPGAQIS